MGHKGGLTVLFYNSNLTAYPHVFNTATIKKSQKQVYF